MSLSSLILIVAGGMLGHQLQRPTLEWFPVGRGDRIGNLNRLASYAEGGVLVLIAFTILVWDEIPPQSRMRVLVCNILAFFGIGAGTAAGMIRDLVKGQ